MIKNIIEKIKGWFVANKTTAIIKLISIGIVLSTIITFIIANFGVSKVKYLNIVLVSIAGINVGVYFIIKLIEGSKK